MRYILLTMFVYPTQLLAQSSFYDLSIQSAKGNVQFMSDYKGKKVIIVVAGPEVLRNKNTTGYWDSVQLSNPKQVVIIIPATDLVQQADSTVDDYGKEGGSGKAIVAAIVRSAKKDKGSSQHSLLSWLTRGGKNSHFDLDVTTDNQVYLISESGALYAVLEKGVSKSVINGLLKQEDIKK